MAYNVRNSVHAAVALTVGISVKVKDGLLKFKGVQEDLIKFYFQKYKFLWWLCSSSNWNSDGFRWCDKVYKSYEKSVFFSPIESRG